MAEKRLDEPASSPATTARLAPDAVAQLREIAHELRNPLNALTAIMEIMKDERFGPLGDRRYVEYSALAHDAAAKMMKLCDRLVVSQASQETRAAVNVSTVLLDIAAMFRPMAEARGLSLEVDLAADLPDLAVDAELFGTVLNNLLVNAIKFTPSGGRVTLLARREPLENVAMFVVSDSGIGLDAEELALQMRPTDVLGTGPQIAGAPTVGPHGDTGSGLGLAIARKSIAEMGGTLELRSRKGVGTCAIVRLPLSVSAAVA